MQQCRIWWALVFIAGLVIAPGVALSQAEPAMLFDDFNYAGHDDPQLSENGWIVRTVAGWPGVPGAIWRGSNASFRDDPENAGNRLLLMSSMTDGDRVYQTQVCHQRKYYQGTYAARVRFANAPSYGPDGDQIVETFYLISPQEFDMDPNYSELDFEYLPNGGWGAGNNILFMTSWETFQLSPWIADNDSGVLAADLAGWHTLVIQVADQEIHYYVDGWRAASHGEYYYPEVPMSINFNLWFIDGGLARSRMLRKYVEQIDWVFHAQDVALSPDEVIAQVETLRAQGVTFTDSVPEWQPPLESPCNF